METKYGADPEFVVRNNHGTIISAKTFFSGTSAIIGTDGNNFVGEMRPRPNSDVRLVIADIYNILKIVAKNPHLENHELLAGNYKTCPIGGHIHIDIDTSDRSRCGDLLGRLDKVLHKIVQPILEDSYEKRERESSTYGKAGDFNTTNWGIEYRTCGSWLLSPEIALIYLGFAKMCNLAIEFDLPSYGNAEKCLSVMIEHRDIFLIDVNCAIGLFEQIVENNLIIDWDIDILKCWRVK